MPEVSEALTTQTWMSTIWTGTAVPIISAIVGAAVGVFLTCLFTMLHERKKDKSSTVKAQQKKIEELEDCLKVYEDAEPTSDGDYYILKATGEKICPVCWRDKHKAIRVKGDETGEYTCALCGDHGVHNRRVFELYKAQQAARSQAIYDFNSQDDNNDYLSYWGK